MNKYPPLIVKIEDILKEKGVKFRENSTNLIMDQCYECGKSKKLYVDKNSGAFICFTCEEKGGPVKLFEKYLDMSKKEAYVLLYGKEGKISVRKEMEEEDSLDGKFKLSLDNLKQIKQTELPAIELAPEFELLTEKQIEPWNYLIKRGYTPDDILNLRLYVLPFNTFSEAWNAVSKRVGKDNKKQISDVAKMQGRILFPTYVNYQMVGFVARDYTGEKEPKVLNAEGNFRTHSFWNYDNAKLSKDLIICEGTTSAVKCGIERSVALLGKMATMEQIKLIKTMSAEKLYICLDVGTDKEQSNIFNKLALYYPGKIYKVSLPSVISVKNLNPKLISEIAEKTSYEVTITKDNVVSVPLSVRQDVAKVSLFQKRDNKDEKTEKVVNHFKDKLTPDSLELFAYLVVKGEYLDSGDYSHQEMDAFIKDAKPFQKTIL